MDEFEPDCFDIYTARDLNFFSLPIYEHFHRKPYHACTFTGELDKDRMCDELKVQVIRSDAYLTSDRKDSGAEGARRLLIQVEEGVFCQVQHDGLTVFAATAEIARRTAKQLSETFAKRGDVPSPQFHILSISGGISARRVKLSANTSFTEQDISLNYGSDAAAFEGRLVSCLQTQTGGASIFRGEPGTGKTSFIRHLIAKLHRSHRFYYLPLSAYRYLASPDMVAFWIRESEMSPDAKRVVVLEDAEDLLMQRGPDNATKVSSLLNVADGLLGEFLQMHLICTVNCAIDRLDSAITRPGRLVAYREFRRLKRTEAQRLAESKGITLPEQEDYSLAEIYRSPVIGQVRGSRPGIGFAE